MFPFWDIVIQPVLVAAGARRIVEIGALRGETTDLMLESLGPDVELHVIDPVPEFDPAEHERKFPGRYRFHRDLSLNVLPGLPAVDAALVDGDHNWYTVYHELKQISATAQEAGAPLPVLILHDVCWPYGRRDLYYAPERIPEEFRQPFAQRGMRRDRKQLLPRGGLNPTMFNAVTEGGPRNGVMTALEDFLAEHGRPVRRVVLPIYFGLAIVAEEERLARQPELARVLDRLESYEGSKELLDLAESVRLNAMLFQHNVFYHRERQLEAAADRYLSLLKGALLDEHYLEHELRIDHLVRCLERHQAPDPRKLRDPARYMRPEARALQAARRAGRLSDHNGDTADYFPYTAMGRIRLDHLERCLDQIRGEAISGDLVECGTGRGGGAIFMRGYLEAHEMSEPTVWVADPFRASPPTDGTPSDSGVPGGGRGFPDVLADLNTVRDGFSHFGLLDERVRFLQGPFTSTLHDAPIVNVSLLRLGEHDGEAAGDVLEALYSKVSPGGYIVVDSYASPECRRAVDDFRARRGLTEPVERVDWTGAFWRKGEHVRPASTVATTPAGRVLHAPLAHPAPLARKDLSVVVVFYNMRREAQRTLHSLSRAYQHGVEDLDYEVIAVENGSTEEQRLGEEFVRGFGPEFRYLDLGSDATPSPVAALNRGVAIASGEAFAFMIDGAHVLTPGVLRYGMAGLSTYAPAVVATQQWYVGPGQQGDAMMAGYDQDYEDRLFEEIGWPTDGYGLFDIGHFIGDRDWFDGLWESNCIFAPRSLLEQVGSFDGSFTMPGGGYANLEFYERLASSPDVNMTTIIGEGSFHQVHSGTTTNEVDSGERRLRISGYAQHFADLRGRRFRGPGKTIQYVGRIPPPGAFHTKARIRTARNLFKAGPGDPDALPEKPLPLPQQLKVAFTDAFWRSHAWRKTTWLGQPVEKPPTDLVVYQELISRLRPDWVVETGTGNGGRALFLASICELVGTGRVLSIDLQAREDRPSHPRLTYLTAPYIAPSTVREVREIVGESPNALVILGSCKGNTHMLQEFDLYSPLVPVGSYVVIEDTIVNGHPVWPSFGPGPAETVKNIMNTRGDFASDPDMERFGLTFNPNGFLKRLR